MEKQSYVLLLVEDNENVLTANRMTFERDGHVVYTAMNLAEARKLLSGKKINIAILDIMLPDGNGLSLVPEIREQNKDTKILMLTSKRQYEDILQGLTEGADDYMTKPYRITELKARVMALLLKNFVSQQETPTAINDIKKGTLLLKPDTFQAYLAGEDLALTVKEFQVLRMLVTNENDCISSEQIYRDVWNIPMLKDSQAVRSSLSRLRKKITGSGYTIDFVRNKGYRFSLQSDS